MSLSYDMFNGAFLSKVNEFEFGKLLDEYRVDIMQDMLAGFMKRAIVSFKKVCKYDLVTTANDEERAFDIDIAPEDEDELVEIVSEGMLIQWMKPYIYRQEVLENTINTNDFSTYSPAELLMRISNAYAKAQSDYIQMIREYSYNHGDLTDLHI